MTTGHAFLGHRQTGGATLPLVPPGAPVLHYDGGNIDGSDNTTLTPGQDITTWTDLGSRGVDAVVPGANNAPQYLSPLIAGKLANRDGVFFDLSNTEALAAPIGNPPETQPGVIAVVHFLASIPAPGNSQALFDGSNPGFRWFGFVDGNSASYIYGSGLTNAAGAAADLNAHSIIFTFDSPNSEVNFDGATSSTGDTTGTENLRTQFGIGVLNNATANHLDGGIAEILVYDVAEPAAGIFDYICRKYGGFPQ